VNILFVGKTRSGKSTALNVLRDPNYIAPLFLIPAETRSPEISQFSVPTPSNKILMIHAVDTPGLFERAVDGETPRSNKVILDLISDCLNFEMTRIHHVFITMHLGLDLNPEDLESIEIFSSMFRGIESHISLLLTFSEGYDLPTRDHLLRGLEKVPKINSFFQKINHRVFFLGSLSVQHQERAPALRSVIEEQRSTIIKYLEEFSSCSFHIKVLHQYQQLIAAQSRVRNHVNRLAAYRPLEDFEDWGYFISREEKFIENQKNNSCNTNNSMESTRGD
jgi:hypothetical protein